MLRRMLDLVGFRIRAADGPIGRVQDLYFDDQQMYARNCGKLGTFSRLPGARHLHSAHAMLHDTIRALDGELGHIEDLLINEADWRIHHLLVGTRNCWPDRQVLVSPQWIKPANWPESEVVVNRTYAQIKNNPELIIQK